MRVLTVVVAAIALLSVIYLLDNNTEVLKSHKWCVFDCGGATGKANGYDSNNKDCIKRCTDIQGVSCGKNWQNCCEADKCESHFYGDVCNQRKELPNCTSL